MDAVEIGNEQERVHAEPKDKEALILISQLFVSLRQGRMDETEIKEILRKMMEVHIPEQKIKAIATVIQQELIKISSYWPEILMLFQSINQKRKKEPDMYGRIIVDGAKRVELIWDQLLTDSEQEPINVWVVKARVE